MPDTGRTIGAATDTAAFVRAQIANGVSPETLRRRLKIRPEHMIDMMSVAVVEPQPQPVDRTPARQAPRSGSIDEQRRRIRAHQADAEALLPRVMQAVAAVCGISPPERLMQPGGDEITREAKAMVYGLAFALRPDLSLNSVGLAMGRNASAAFDGDGKCRRLRAASPAYDRLFQRALALLNAPPDAPPGLRQRTVDAYARCAKRAAEQEKPKPAGGAISRDDVLSAVADAWQTDTALLLVTGDRLQARSRPRKAVFLLMCRLMGYSADRIANALGMAHGSAVRRGIGRAEGLYKYDDDWRRRYDMAEAAIKSRANRLVPAD